MNLFDGTKSVDPFNPGMRDRRTRNDGPRDCTERELRAYLDWLAERDGIAVPAGARYCARGIVIGGTMDRNGAHTGGTVILAMPGYGQSQTVMYELLDDAGNVVKSFPLPADKSGKLPMTAKQVREWSGLARLTASGVMLTGSDAGMSDGGQLNPRHSLWLMLGPFANSWLAAGERVRLSRSRSRKREPSKTE